MRGWRAAVLLALLVPVLASCGGGAASMTTPSRPASSPAAAVVAASAEVPMFRGNAARTGEMPGPGPAAGQGIAPRWRFGTGDPVSSSPAVAGGVVYVGSEDHNLYALDAATGTERWRFATGDVVLSSPAVAGGVVYVGSQDRTVYALGPRPLILEAGGRAVTRVSTALRGAPAASGVERAALPPGTAVAITDTAVAAGSQLWWPVRVEATGALGWVLAADLVPTANAPGTPVAGTSAAGAGG